MVRHCNDAATNGFPVLSVSGQASTFSKRCHRRCGIVLAPHRLADRDEVGAGLDQRPGIVGRDPADRDAGDFEQRRPPAQDRRSAAGSATAWSWSDRRRRTRHSRRPPRPPPSPGGGCRGRSCRSARPGRAAPAPRGHRRRDWPRWTPSAPSRLASAMLSLTMNAASGSAQMRCSGSASRASSCSATSLTRSWKPRLRPARARPSSGQGTRRRRPAG